MTTKITIFSALILGITCTGLVAMEPFEDRVVSKVYTNTEYYRQELLPRQKELIAEFPDISARTALTIALIEKEMEHPPRSQGRDTARKLIGTTAAYDINNNESLFHTENDSKK